MTQRIVRIAPMQAAKMLPVLLGAKNAPPMWLPLLLVPVLA